MIAPLPFGLALALAAISGFVALSYEILWTRLFSFMSGSRAEAFGAFLGFYLIGLAVGSLFSRRCQDWVADSAARGRLLSRLFLGANLAAFLVAPAISWAVVSFDWLRTLAIVLFGSALLGIILPLLCHFSIPADQRSGVRMSYVYIANIVGSGLGSLLTGFVLMDILRFWQISALLLLLAAGVAAALLRVSARPAKADWILGCTAVGLAAASVLIHDGLFERLMYKEYYRSFPRFTQTVEDRHGVITVERDEIVYGNGVYDGKIDLRPRTGGGLFRPFFVSALHPAPRNILVIGMSAGAWAQILAHHPQAEHVTVVEISAGYIELIRSHPAMRNLLTNPKVEIVIDDGRRWLRRNPERRFDVIVMNTTYYWREFASALLSEEFLTLAKEHLRDGGMVMWNCTGSARAASTGLLVFPSTLMVGNNCVGSIRPLAIDQSRWAGVLRSYVIDGKPVFDQATAEGRRELADTLAFVDISGGNQSDIMSRPDMLKSFGAAPVITDDNLGQEYEFDFSTHPTLLKLLRAAGRR